MRPRARRSPDVAQRWREKARDVLILAATAVAVTAGVGSFATKARSGVLGSPHDFSATGPNTQSSALAPSGVCSSCHFPHGAQDFALWPRDLSPYRSALGDRDGIPSTEPNFLLSPTINCYDCHEYHGGGAIEAVPNPALSAFAVNHRPQNVLSGFTKVGLGSMTEDAFGGSVAGFYETNPPGPSSSYGVNFGAPLDQTGGHYFKQDPTASSGDQFDAGDKLPCRDCHDPHAWEDTGNWQAFFRRNWPSGSPVPSRVGPVAVASTGMASDSTPGGGRSDPGSRQLCIACHGTSDTLLAVNFSDIAAGYRSALIVRPPSAVAAHADSATAACVGCHPHNAIGVSCSGCHGFPPSDTASVRYPASFMPSPDPGAQDAHPRHTGAKSGQAANSYSVNSFGCEVCHYGAAGAGAALGHHQNGRVSVVLQGTYTKAGGTYDNSNYYNPGYGVPPAVTGELDNTASSTGWGYPSPQRYGWDSCRFVYCHSAGREKASLADNEYRVPVWNTGKLGCNGCHGDPAIDNTNSAYGMPPYANGGAGTQTANSHAAHVVTSAYECSVCHAGTATGSGAGRAIVSALPALHVNTIREVQFDGTTASGSYNNVEKSCSVTCHGAGAPRWGGTLAGGCFDCHAGAEQAWKPQAFGDGVPNPVDNTQYLQSGHGRTGTGYPVSGNPPAGKWSAANRTGCYSDDPETGCHARTAAHTTPAPADPYRLGSGYQDNTTGLCLSCHGAAGPAETRNMQEHSKAVTGSGRAWPGPDYAWKCVDCHDPHGDGTDAGRRIDMIRRAINNPTGADNASIGSDSKGRPLRSPAWDNIAFSDNTGLAAGSYAAPGTGNWGICEGCHRQTYTYNQVTDNASGHSTTGCMGCHDHAGGFKGAGGAPGANCKGCHNAPQAGADAFRSVRADFDKAARHVGTWDNLASRDCENCHYALHGGYPKLWMGAAANHPSSPAEGTDYFVYRKGVTVKATVDRLCLSCHNDAYNGLPANTGQDWKTATKFSTGGAVPSPNVAARWLDNGTAPYSKYDPSVYNVVPQIVKAYSPHRRAVTNRTKPDSLGIAETHGYVDGNWPPANNSVGCLECHPAHGSNLVSGHGGDYSAAGLGKGGYMLAEENTKNQSGNIHDPSDNPAGATAPYADEEALCWSCHVRGWDYRGDDTGTARTRWQGSWQGDVTWVGVKSGSLMSSHFYPNRAAMNSWSAGTPSGIARTDLACSTCHDPHGISSTDTNAAYRVPALRGTWLTSPYKEDRPPSSGNFQTDTGADWRKGIDRKGIAVPYGPTASGGTATNKGARMVPDLGLGASGTKNNPTTPGFGYSATKAASVGDGYFIDENTFGVGPVGSTTSGGGWRHASAPASMEWGSWDGYSSLSPGSNVAAPDPATKWWIRPRHFDGTLGYDVAASGGISAAGGAAPTVAPSGGMTDAVFAGLCLACHSRTSLTGGAAVYEGHVTVAGWHGDKAWRPMSDDTNRPFMHQQQRVGINNYLGVDGTWGALSNPPSSWPHDGPVGYRWGVDPGWITGTGTAKTPTAKAQTQAAYHRFPCSKCHTPHASRLPRLMVTNCLDVGASDTQIKNTSYAYPQTTIVPTDGQFGLLTTTKPWEYAVTCHADRDGKPGGRSTGSSQQWVTGAPGTSGWNDVTPW